MNDLYFVYCMSYFVYASVYDIQYTKKYNIQTSA